MNEHIPTLEELHSKRDYETIVQRFENYLGRYREIFNPRTSTRKVLGLAKASDIRRTLSLVTHSGNAEQIHVMRNTIIDNFGYEEMCQVIYLAFMVTLSKFDCKRGVPLEKYIYNFYPYYLSTEITNLASPPYNQPRINLPSQNDYSDSQHPEFAVSEVGYTSYPEFVPSEPTVIVPDKLFEEVQLDYKWVSGETCTEPFTCLTILERKLLVLLFVEGYTQEEVAQEMDYHFSSVKRKKAEIIEKLRNRLIELEMI